VPDAAKFAAVHKTVAKMNPRNLSRRLYLLTRRQHKLARRYAGVLTTSGDILKFF
jgi:hypothetical protein